MPRVVTIHQPNYLPWLGFFHKALISDAFVVLDDVQFEKNSFNNRNKVKTSNEWAWLTVPIITKGQSKETMINSARIDNGRKWYETHLKTIKFNYSKAKYFEEYFGFFEETYETEWEILSELNIHIIKWLFKELGIKTEVVVSSEMESKEGVKDELVLNICKKMDAETYVAGKLSKDYLDEQKFEEESINVHYQNYKHPEYEQLWGDFIPNMSVIDLLFNHGPESREIIMKDNVNKEDIK